MRKGLLAAAAAASLVALSAWLVLEVAAPGGWIFSQSEDGTQALYLKNLSAAGQPALFRLACNDEDGVIWFNSQAISGETVEKRSGTRHQLDLTLSGGRDSLVLEGYVTSAPEGASASWEAPRTTGLLGIVSAPDFAIAGPSLSLKGRGAAALNDFARACPPVDEPARDGMEWGTLTSLVNGYRLEIPRALFRIAWGDRFGRGYVSEKGNASLVVMGGVNALELSLSNAMKEGGAGLPALDRETYRTVGRESAIVSGYSGQTIVYYKARATCGGANIVYFILSYDTSARALFDPVVARMARSFDATMLPSGEPICP